MESKPYIRKPWERTRSPVEMDPEKNVSVTDSSFGNDTDINNIVARFSRTGNLPAQQPGEVQYADVTNLQGDLAEMIDNGRDAAAELNAIQSKEKIRRQTELQTKLARLDELEAAADAASNSELVVE